MSFHSLLKTTTIHFLNKSEVSPFTFASPKCSLVTKLFLKTTKQSSYSLNVFPFSIQTHTLVFCGIFLFQCRRGYNKIGNQSLFSLPFLKFPLSSSVHWAGLHICKATARDSTVQRTSLSVSVSLFRNTGKTHLCMSQSWSSSITL